MLHWQMVVELAPTVTLLHETHHEGPQHYLGPTPYTSYPPLPPPLALALCPECAQSLEDRGVAGLVLVKQMSSHSAPRATMPFVGNTS